jgi:general secretion pathway protein I
MRVARSAFQASGPRPLQAPRRSNGFTLVEMLVALAVVAVTLAASHKVGASLLRGIARQDDVLLGQLCAENALVELRLARRLPGIGSSDSLCEQAGLRYVVRLNVRGTADADARHIDAQVLREGHPVLTLSATQR